MDRAAVDELKRAANFGAIVGKHTKLGRANARGVRTGACICAPARGKSPLWVNERNAMFGCLKGGCSGNIFKFLEQFDGLDFLAALAFLGGSRENCAASPKERACREKEISERDEKRAESERRRAFEIWRAGVPSGGTLADAYFCHRGLALVRSKALRFAAAERYYMAVPDGAAAMVFSGPCLLAAIQDPLGKFLGLHRTWLDPRLGTDAMPPEASGKAILMAPDGQILPPKKMRGRKQGGAIRLHDFDFCASGPRLFLAGEGIETVEAFYQIWIKSGKNPGTLAAWAAGDLGNLAGSGLGEGCPHPSNHKMRLPDHEPDPQRPGMMPPAFTEQAILLGDGDSDPLVTGAMLERARRRWKRAGIPTKIVMADAGADFNDLVRAA